MVRINRTTFSDTNDDGSGFVFHSTSIHTIASGDDDEVVVDTKEVKGADEETEDAGEGAEFIPEVSEATTEKGVDEGLLAN